MMAIVPALMVLYSSDAVEIRYSDGSSLELSPCGSSMIYVKPPNARGYSRCDQSRKVQKRTRFVTSEHRHKVLQALDFRNRFAERSYLCSDLLPREEIVALYAKIDEIAWPQKLGEARIDVLPDGSRSITSLDEFATLIVSPHGHDYTVCFLSRISRDKRKSKDAVLQKSNSVSHGASLKSSSETTCLFDAKCSAKLSQVLIKPFEKSGHLDVRLLNDIDQSQVVKDLQDFKIKNTFVAPQIKSGQLVSDNLTSEEVSAKDEKGEILKCNMEDNETKSKLARDCSDNTRNISCNQNNEGCSEKLIDNPDVYCCNADSMSKEEKHHSTASFSADCPNSFDISSISRSSTPDGLRTTVELDTTLPHDILLSSFQGQMLDHRQRRNSPTHTSSPYDAPPGLPSKNPDLIKKQEDVLLSSSFLGNQKVQNHRKEGCSNAEITQLIEFSDSGKDNSSSTVNNSTRVVVNDFQLQTSAVDINESISCLPNELDCSDTLKCSKQIDIESDITSNADKTLRQIPKTPGYSGKTEHSDQIGAGSDLTKSGAATARTVCFKTSSGYKSSQVEVVDIPGSVPGSEGHCFDGREVNEEENTNERQCRERYVWTTKHCSTHDCPVMWAHPLRLVLESGNLTNEGLCHNSDKERQPSTPTDRKNCIFTRVPSPLPVTCPLQHNHRLMSSDIVDDDEDSEANSLQFQHGRLKVVICEGVVYRLAQKADLKTVEIYPGDGSVFVSHGVQGHFFTHFLLVGDQIQERTYSLKSLPHRQSQVEYSIKRLIETANRLSQMNATWEHQNLKEDVPCWKKDVVAVVEPLSPSLLEECVVEGLGKFSAFTNGRVRIVFEDRTALDMVCNVSRRVQDCFTHSPEPVVSLPCASSVSPPVPTYDYVFGASTVRLLLPCGEYVTVDIKNPGPYRKYIGVAQEWASWIMSSPMERQQFYANYNTPAILQQAVEIELKKIFCFNYILEQTLLMQQQQQLNSIKSSSLTNNSIPSSEHAADIRPSNIPRSQPVGCHMDTMNSHRDPQRPLDPRVPGDEFRTSKPTCPSQLKGSSDAFLGNKSLPASSDQSWAGLRRDGSAGSHAHSDTSPRVDFKSCRISENSTLDFESVRQILLQNSNLISDIDLFLESSRKV